MKKNGYKNTGKNKAKKKETVKRVLALLVIAALVVSMIISVVISAMSTGYAYGEEAADSYSFEMELVEDAQALRVTQRLAFYNRTGQQLDRVMLAVYANMFRRESTVMYETAAAQPYGYNPGGVEFYSVKVNGEEARWAVQGGAEYFMRVECDIAPDELCEMVFVYDVLVTRNAAFIGVDDKNWRFSGFYPTLCVFRDGIWEANAALQHTRYTLTTPADYHAEITLPDMYALSGTGTEARRVNGDGTSTWTIDGTGLREFAFSVGRAWRSHEGETASGVKVNVLTASRKGGPEALETAIETIELYEDWFGPFPTDNVDIVETDLAAGAQAFAGCIWLDRDVFDDDGSEGLVYQLRRGLAEQYFGISVYSDPVAQAWLGVSVPEYIAYLACETIDGDKAFVERMEMYFLDAMNVTIPSNLVMNTDAALFSQAQFTTVVRHRGAMAMHEFRCALGRRGLLDALQLWYALHGGGAMVNERDFLETFKSATGKDWEDFLTDLIFNFDEYSQQSLYWYE